MGISWPCHWHWSRASLLSVSALFSSLLVNLKCLPCSDAPLRNTPSIPVFSPPPSRHIPYSPWDPLSYAPPYPISPSDPVTLISCYSCCVRLNHFHVEYTSGPVHINSLVQDDNWDGPLLVLRWVAANSMEIVGECEGRDFEGQRIIRFLFFTHFHVRRLEDVILFEGMRRLRQYPCAPDSSVFFCKGLVVLLWILYIFGQWLCSLDINTLFISIYSLEPYLLHCTQNNPIDVVWFCLVWLRST